MAKGKPPAKRENDSSTATIGFEAKLWLAADTALRGSAFLQTGGKLQVMPERHDNRSTNMDAAETSCASKTAAGSPQGERGGAHQYKHVVLGLIFLKYISDTFE